MKEEGKEKRELRKGYESKVNERSLRSKQKRGIR